MSFYVALAIVFISFILHSFMKRRTYELPPGPTGVPVLGYLPFLGKNPLQKFQELRKEFGDIFSLNLGGRLMVVVTDAEAAKELLSKPTTLDRPENLFAHLPGGGGFSETNGAEWSEQRRYTISEMKNLGFGRSDWEKLAEEEACDFLDYLERFRGEPVDVYEELSASISNNVLSLVTGHRLPRGHPKRKLIDQGLDSFEAISDQSSLISNFPMIFNLAVKMGLIEGRQMIKEIENMSRCIREQIDEAINDETGESFVQRYMNEIEKNERLNQNSFFNYKNLLGNCQSLIIAGSDTTKVSLYWLFLILASHPEVQEKLHQEVDAVLGKDGKAGWADRLTLPYCVATIYEAQRWRTVVPLNLLHRTSEDTKFRGYDIPKGTRILTVISIYQSDPKYWKNPEVFQPERFLAEDGKVISDPVGYAPFSYGKRNCVGKTVALVEIFLYFVPIIQKFRILPVSDGTKIDLEGHPGLTLHPHRQPLRFIPR